MECLDTRPGNRDTSCHSICNERLHGFSCAPPLHCRCPIPWPCELSSPQCCGAWPARAQAVRLMLIGSMLVLCSLLVLMSESAVGTRSSTLISNLNMRGRSSCWVLAGAGLMLILLELVVHFLPVSSGPQQEDGGGGATVEHYVPNSQFTWSRDWDFLYARDGMVNQLGYPGICSLSVDQEHGLHGRTGPPRAGTRRKTDRRANRFRRDESALEATERRQHWADVTAMLQARGVRVIDVLDVMPDTDSGGCGGQPCILFRDRHRTAAGSKALVTAIGSLH